MPSQLKRATLKMPIKGKIATLPGYALPPNAFEEITNFTYDQRKTPGLMPGWAKFHATSLDDLPIMLIDQFYKNDGSSYFLVADTEQIWEYDPALSTWSTTAGNTFAGDYTNLFSADVWPEAGSELYIVTNGVDIVQAYDGTNPIDDLAGLDDAADGAGGAGVDVETARVVKIFEEFVVLLYTTEDGSTYPQRVRWSKKGYADVWKNTLGLGEAGLTDLIETTDWCVTAERLGYYLMIYKERSIYTMEYVGSPTVMRFNRIVDGVGALGQKCIASLGDSHIMLGNDNVYEVTPGGFEPIGDDIKSELFSLMNPERHDQVSLFLKEETDEILLSFPSTASNTADKFYVYNYVMRNWTGPHDRDSTAFGYYQAVDDKTWDNLVGSWTAQVGFWDDRSFQTNSPINIMGDYDGYLYTLNTGISADGTAIDGKMVWGLTDLDSPEVLKRVQKLWLAIDRGNTGNLKAYVGYTDSPNNAVSWYGPVTVSMNGNSVEVDVDVTAKYVQLRIESDSGVPFRLLGVTVGYIERQGTR